MEDLPTAFELRRQMESEMITSSNSIYNEIVKRIREAAAKFQTKCDYVGTIPPFVLDYLRNEKGYKIEVLEPENYIRTQTENKITW